MNRVGGLILFRKIAGRRKSLTFNELRHDPSMGMGCGNMQIDGENKTYVIGSATCIAAGSRWGHNLLTTFPTVLGHQQFTPNPAQAILWGKEF